MPKLGMLRAESSCMIGSEGGQPPHASAQAAAQQSGTTQSCRYLPIPEQLARRCLGDAAAGTVPLPDLSGSCRAACRCRWCSRHQPQPDSLDLGPDMLALHMPQGRHTHQARVMTRLQMNGFSFGTLTPLPRMLSRQYMVNAGARVT